MIVRVHTRLITRLHTAGGKTEAGNLKASLKAVLLENMAGKNPPNLDPREAITPPSFYDGPASVAVSTNQHGDGLFHDGMKAFITSTWGDDTLDTLVSE